MALSLYIYYFASKGNKFTENSPNQFVVFYSKQIKCKSQSVIIVVVVVIVFSLSFENILFCFYWLSHLNQFLSIQLVKCKLRSIWYSVFSYGFNLKVLALRALKVKVLTMAEVEFCEWNVQNVQVCFGQNICYTFSLLIHSWTATCKLLLISLWISNVDFAKIYKI